jgi:hypothetical protein
VPFTGSRVKAAEEQEAIEVVGEPAQEKGERLLGVDAVGVAPVLVVGVDGESHLGVNLSAFWIRS